MPLAIFDLDNTLLSGDSDYLWGEFLCDRQIVDRDFYERENQRFYEEYKQGKLDFFVVLDFSLRRLSQHDMQQLHAWHREFMKEKIEPLITPRAEELVAMHRERGDTLLIVTATNAFVTAPIAARFGIDNLIATNPEIVAGRYTGHVSGEPSYRQGKVVRLREWLAMHGEMLDGSWFYSDSHNDVPLLEIVDNPVVVDPDEILAREAESRGWPVISLR